jgi:muramoyltetrapeptide carboxypeptidase
MIPKKLVQGDEIRVVSPARSLSIISEEQKLIANKRFEELGLKVSFSKNSMEKDEFVSSSIKSRVDDLHEAFVDKNVKAILTTIGGFNSNQLLKYLDYNLIKSNPKIFCGFSDITALQNAIFAKTGLVTYSGPHYSTFSVKNGFDYTLEYFKKCLMQENEFEIIASKEWSDDEWWANQEKREFISNNGFKVFSHGKAQGTIIGGNLCTLNLLQGTEFMPSLKDKIVFVEDDWGTNPFLFDRDLQSLLHQPGFEKVKALLIGRFQKKSEFSKKILEKILSTKKELQNIPIIYDLDFGHTHPLFTFPIGGKINVSTSEKKIKIWINSKKD